MTTLQGAILQSPGTPGIPAGMAFIMTTAANEIIEELADKDEETMRFYLKQLGEIIAWVGHGDNSLLPESVRAFAENIQPSSQKAVHVSAPVGANT